MPGSATEWITAVAAVLALGMSMMALVFSRRSTKAAERSACAAEESAALAKSAEQRAAAVRWEVIDAGGWQLTPHGLSGSNSVKNVGGRTAHDVRIDVPEANFAGQGRKVTEVPPNSAVKVAVSLSNKGTLRDLQVRWRNDSNDSSEQSWSHHIVVPPRHAGR